MFIRASWDVVSLVLCQTFECFSYYGLRSVLILFMTNFLGFSDTKAFGKYVAMIAIADVLSSLGGYIGDKYLNHRLACSTGVLLIFFGLLLLALFFCNEMNNAIVYLGMAFVSCGVSLFRPNNMTMICDGIKRDAKRFACGKVSKEQEKIALESGMTIAYGVIDIGFLFAYFLSGILMEKIGWKEVFSILSIGSLISFAFIAFSSSKIFQGIKKLPLKLLNTFALLIFLLLGTFFMITNHWLVVYFSFSTAAISMIFFFRLLKIAKNKGEKAKLFGLLSYMVVFMFFVALERQNSMSIVLFFKRNVDRNFFDFEIPVVTLMSIMPITIMIFGPIVSSFLKRSRVKSLFPGYRFIIGFSLICSSFFLLYLGCIYGCQSGKVCLLIPVLSLMLCSIADATIVPSLFSMCNRLAPSEKKGFISGLAMLIISFGHIVSSGIASSMAIKGAEKNEIDLLHSLAVYRAGFKNVSIFCFVCICICIGLKFLFDKITVIELSD